MWSQQTVQAGVNPLGIWAAGKILFALVARKCAHNLFVEVFSAKSSCKTDFTGDGWPDICVSTGNSIGVLSNNGLLPGGAVGFTNMLFFGAGNAPAEIVVADLNGDGKLDIATPNYYGNSVSILLNNAQVSFLPNIHAQKNSFDGFFFFKKGGKVSFAAAVNYATGSRPWGIDSGDFDRYIYFLFLFLFLFASNSDNLTDLVVTNVAENTVSILFGVNCKYLDFFF